ncbi:MAG: glycosyltransferase [Candidatus Hodarchaeota archaeon]
MDIDILCRDGSPLGVSMRTLWGEDQIGVGGSEYGLLTLCEEWYKAGHRVRLYNNPRDPRGGSPFGQFPIGSFVPSDRRDVLINFRSPSEQAIVSNGLKIWLSCDQYTIGDYAKFAPAMDKIVCISPFHQTYFRGTYDIENTIVIDLPVRVHDLDGISVEKRPNSLIFTSVPDRGLHFLRQAWDRLKREIPDLSLTITSDYRLWGLHEPRNERFRQDWIALEDVSFVGAVKRQTLLEIQLAADLFVFPNIYDELFCVSLAEAQVCGAYPITSEVGALRTTSLGTLIRGNPMDGRSGFLKRFQNEIIEILKDRNALEVKRESMRKRAIERFHPDNIMKQWEERVFK